MRFVTKDFLSDSPDESGSIICNVSTALVKDLSSYVVGEGGRLNASVRIADCSEHVILDFDAYGQKNYDKRMKKLDKLIEKLQAMRSQCDEMWSSHQRDIEFFKKQDGKK